MAMEGWYGDAMNALRSQGCAAIDDPVALLNWHFVILKMICQNGLLKFLQLWVLRLTQPVLDALKAFPGGNSPGLSQLQAQHILDAVKALAFLRLNSV